MKADKIRQHPESELHKKLSDYRKELFNLCFQHETGQLQNNQRIKKVKRNIARILTIMRENEMESRNELPKRKKKTAKRIRS